MSLPTAPSRTMNQDTFDAATDAFIGALPQFETDMNALATAMTLNATTDASLTSNTVGTGPKTFAVSAGKSFWPGMWLIVADTSAPATNYIFAQVTSYAGTALVVNAVASGGSGTIASWQVSQSAPATTPVAGSDIASAATIDISALRVAVATVTGTTPTSAITMASGQIMILEAAGAWPLTNNATTMKLPSGVDTTLTAGDRLLVWKDLAGVINVHIMALGGSRVVTSAQNTSLVTGSGTNNVLTDCGISITLPPGKYDIEISGMVGVDMTGTGQIAGILALRTTTTANTAYVSGGRAVGALASTNALASAGTAHVLLPSIVVAATTTYYVGVGFTFFSGTPSSGVANAHGPFGATTIRATRIGG